MLWTPTKEWDGEDAYIIGGGASLRHFDLNLLKGKNTIGCNDAFRLGEDICKMCLFGDASYFHKTKWDLEKFKNPIISVAPSLISLEMDMLRMMKREREGLYEGSSCGWNFSTGASAVNIALSLGAKRVFLMGIDLVLVDGKSHWHNYRNHPTRDIVFGRFIKGFKAIHSHLFKYPGREVIHVMEGPSKIPFFPQMGLKEVADQLQPMECVA